MAAPAPAQPQRIHFERLNVEDGLSIGKIYSMIQDRRGFLWFGTDNGLNRYDGYTFKVYATVPFDSTSLLPDAIADIEEASDGARERTLLRRRSMDFKDHILERDLVRHRSRRARRMWLPGRASQGLRQGVETSDQFEGAQRERDSFSDQGLETILDMEVKMGSKGLPRIPDPSDHLPRLYIVALFNRDGAGPQVGVDREVSWSDVYDHHIPGDGLRRIRCSGDFLRERSVLR